MVRKHCVKHTETESINILVKFCFTIKSGSLHVLIGCVRLASLGRPRGAHSGEPQTRANRTITLALSW